MNQKPVPVLITWDVDPDRWATVEHRENALSLATDLCEEFGIQSTFFFTAKFAHEYPDHIHRMQALDQEIGCHGLCHTDEEDYNRMPMDLQRKYVGEATQKLQSAVGTRIYSFRSPRVKTSAQALKVLSEYGYQTDSSVCSQRIDLLSSNLINPGWLIAPRRPYHPHPTSAFRRGNLPIWEVPISAFFIPFISSSLKVLGLGWMKALFSLLHVEAQVTGKPIIYLAHPTEFIGPPQSRTRLTRQDFSINRIRTHGLLARNLLFRLGGPVLLDATRELFAYIASFPNVTFPTCSEYIRHLNGSTYLDLS